MNKNRGYVMRLSAPIPDENEMNYPPKTFKQVTQEQMKVALENASFTIALHDNTKEQEAVLNKRNPGRKVKKDKQDLTIDM